MDTWLNPGSLGRRLTQLSGGCDAGAANQLAGLCRWLSALLTISANQKCAFSFSVLQPIPPR